MSRKSHHKKQSLVSIKFIKRFAAVLVVALVLPLLVFLLVTYIFSGGIGNVIKNMKPAPDPVGVKVTDLRSEAQAALNKEHRHLRDKLPFQYYSTASSDLCFTGQNNFKTQTGYAHRCSLSQTAFYGFNTDFRPTVIELEKALLTDDWVPPKRGLTFSSMLHDYYDTYRETGTRFDKHYSVSDLPAVEGYAKNDLVLNVDYVERSEPNYFSLESIQKDYTSSLDIFYERDRFIPGQTLFNEITRQNTYIIAFTIKKNYFNQE